jgi:hypothetical protein
MDEYRCTRGTGCELWEDDDMLLEEGQRRGGDQVEVAPVPVEAPILLPPPYQERLAIPDEPRLEEDGEFHWITDDGMYLIWFGIFILTPSSRCCLHQAHIY